MNKKFAKSIVASLMAISMVTPTTANIVPLNVIAVNTAIKTAESKSECKETIVNSDFSESMLPWEGIEVKPAYQNLDIEAGALHTIIRGEKGNSNTDLQIVNKDLSFKKGHNYWVSFRAKASRKGLELCSQITDASGDKQYFVLNDTEWVIGPAMGGQFGKWAELSDKYITYQGIFTPTEDIENAVWSFYYANDNYGYGGNAVDGDEIWFDDMSILCTDCLGIEPDIPSDDDNRPPSTPPVDDDDDNSDPLPPPSVDYDDDDDNEKEEAYAEILVDSRFDNEDSIWEQITASPADQKAAIEDGALHINILEGTGADTSKWDLQTLTRKIYLKAGETYKIGFKAKANRKGLELDSQIVSRNGADVYVNLFEDKMAIGPALGGDFGKGAALDTEYKYFECTFTMTDSAENLNWVFHYANDTNGFGGNAVAGDEIWLDDLYLVRIADENEEPIDWKPNTEVPETNDCASTIVDSNFDNNVILPWEGIEVKPAYQNLDIEAGALHTIIRGEKGNSNTDLQIVNKDLSFKKGHNYWVSFRAKASRKGLELCSQITDASGDKQYFVLNDTEWVIGPAMGGQFGKWAELSDKYITYQGIFTPTEDIENAVWSFYYANDNYGYGGNAVDGDEIWFDDMSILCTDCLGIEPDIPSDDDNRPPSTPPVDDDDDNSDPLPPPSVDYDDDDDNEKEEAYAEILVDSRFDNEDSIWEQITASPADQKAAIEDGALHINILEGTGADTSKWDLQTLTRKIYLKAGETYKIGFKAKANRKGLELDSQIVSRNGADVYVNLFEDKMAIGPALGGDFGKGAALDTEYKYFECTFTMTDSAENLNWVFHYANDTNGFGGNAVAGDEIWLDDLYLVRVAKENEEPIDWKPNTVPTTLSGDITCDGNVLLNDAVLILQHLGNPDEYPLTEQAKINGDVDNPGSGLTNKDALKIQQFLLGFDGLE